MSVQSVLPKKMKAAVLEKFGTPFQLQDMDLPSVQSRQVLIKVAASGINPIDIKIKAGQSGYAKVQIPAVLGIDLSGTIVQMGSAVTEFRLGDEVYGMAAGIAGLQGSLAEFVAVDADFLAHKPKTLTWKEAAALPLIFITAWEGFVDRAQTKSGMSVLVHGGAGGVGHIAIQLAKILGAEVYATASSRHHEKVRSLGAIPIDQNTTSVSDYMQEFTAGRGFDIVFDTVGGKALDDSLGAVKKYSGHVVSAAGWGTHSLAPLSFLGASYSGIFTLLPLLTGEGRAHHGRILKQATAYVESGKLKPILDSKSFTLATASDAYDHFETKKATGKVVIEIR